MDIKVWIGNLAEYNSGNLVGKWYRLPIDEDEVREELQIGDGDYEIMDYECPFEIDRYTQFEDLNDIASLTEKMKWEEGYVIEEIAKTFHVEPLEAIFMYLNDSRVYHCDTMADVAMEYYEDSPYFDKDNPLFKYIDWEEVGETMEINGSFVKAAGMIVEIFW